MSYHSVHIPVMGTGFSNDTAIRLAPYGLSSAISLVSDHLLEVGRRQQSDLAGRSFAPINAPAPDRRAQRIRAYLDLVSDLVEEKTEALRSSSFSEPRGIRRYFELLPSTHPHRVAYKEFIAAGASNSEEEARLRTLIQPGNVDVNIMTKLDGDKDARGEALLDKHSEALQALRGFAESRLCGAVIFSAGANPRLFAHLSDFECFFPTASNPAQKRIILKVSDFRSALVQGKMLARRGLFVSEYRIESGLNCGGHAFPTEGVLLGTILQEFKERRQELEAGLFEALQKGLASAGRDTFSQPPEVRITVQGGIGTHAEDVLLRDAFALDGTGWGSPFLKVAEAVPLDQETSALLDEATPKEVALSWSSPLGVRFWTLTTSPSEVAKMDRIQSGHSGSICNRRHLALSDEYGKVPLCKGSRAYQKRKLAELDVASPHHHLVLARITAPACICDDLGGALEREVDAHKDVAPPPAICPGPNVVNFPRMTLEELVDHIYGRADVLAGRQRPHMFIREAELYLDVLDEEISLVGTPLQTRDLKKLHAFIDNFEASLADYRRLLETRPELAYLSCEVARLERAAQERRINAENASHGLRAGADVAARQPHPEALSGSVG